MSNMSQENIENNIIKLFKIYEQFLDRFETIEGDLEDLQDLKIEKRLDELESTVDDLEAGNGSGDRCAATH